MEQELSQDSTPVLDNSSEKEGVTVQKRWSKPIFFGILFSIGLLIFGVFVFFRFLASSPQTESDLISITGTPQNANPTAYPSVQQPPSDLPDFSNNPVIPKTNIDTSNWKTFDDPKVGLRFKYPPEWGEAKGILRKGAEAGWSYQLTFNDLYDFFRSVYGRSLDWNCGGCGGESKDFPVGFGSDTYGFSKYTTVRFIQYPKCSLGSLINLKKQFDVYRPGHQILLIRFSIGIERRREELDELICSEGSQKMTLLEEKYKKAIENRQLDNETMINFDVAEKVFETVESY